MLFELIAERYERKSLAITANTTFSQWGDVFVDPAKIVDAGQEGGGRRRNAPPHWLGPENLSGLRLLGVRAAGTPRRHIRCTARRLCLALPPRQAAMQPLVQQVRKACARFLIEHVSQLLAQRVERVQVLPLRCPLHLPGPVMAGHQRTRRCWGSAGLTQASRPASACPPMVSSGAGG